MRLVNVCTSVPRPTHTSLTSFDNSSLVRIIRKHKFIFLMKLQSMLRITTSQILIQLLILILNYLFKLFKQIFVSKCYFYNSTDKNKFHSFKAIFAHAVSSCFKDVLYDLRFYILNAIAMNSIFLSRTFSIALILQFD